VAAFFANQASVWENLHRSEPRTQNTKGTAGLFVLFARQSLDTPEVTIFVAGRIGNFYCFLGCRVYGVVLTLKLSDPMGPPRVNQRCIPNIVTQVRHPNRDLTIKRSGYDAFLGCHIGPHFNSGCLSWATSAAPVMPSLRLASARPVAAFRFYRQGVCVVAGYPWTAQSLETP
jgi:hypothetical protein